MERRWVSSTCRFCGSNVAQNESKNALRHPRKGEAFWCALGAGMDDGPLSRSTLGSRKPFRGEASGSLVMKGSGVRVPPSASHSAPPGGASF